MKKHLTLCLLLTLLSACEGDMRNTLGLTRDAPDEFVVVSRPPLTVPPEFTLRPPRPGEAPRGIPTDEQARSLITGKTPGLADPAKLEQSSVTTAVTPVVQSDALSGGASSLLKRAGVASADDGIREKLGQDALTPRDDIKAKTLMDQLTGADKAEPVVDAKKESERLRSNKDTGKPLNEGEIPVEKKGTDALIDRIF